MKDYLKTGDADNVILDYDGNGYAIATSTLKAKHIIKCVNNHDDLKKSLEWALEQIDNLSCYAIDSYRNAALREFRKEQTKAEDLLKKL